MEQGNQEGRNEVLYCKLREQIEALYYEKHVPRMAGLLQDAVKVDAELDAELLHMSRMMEQVSDKGATLCFATATQDLEACDDECISVSAEELLVVSSELCSGWAYGLALARPREPPGWIPIDHICLLAQPISRRIYLSKKQQWQVVRRLREHESHHLDQHYEHIDSDQQDHHNQHDQHDQHYEHYELIDNGQRDHHDQHEMQSQHDHDQHSQCDQHMPCDEHNNHNHYNQHTHEVQWGQEDVSVDSYDCLSMALHRLAR